MSHYRSTHHLQTTRPLLLERVFLAQVAACHLVVREKDQFLGTPRMVMVVVVVVVVVTHSEEDDLEAVPVLPLVLPHLLLLVHHHHLLLLVRHHHLLLLVRHHHLPVVLLLLQLVLGMEGTVGLGSV